VPQGERFFSQLGQRKKRRPAGYSGDIVKVEVPEELDWFIWRPILHEKRLCTLHELETIYGLPALAEMHVALDLQDELTAKVNAENKRRAEAPRNQ
jgi:hypothetical protein